MTWIVLGSVGIGLLLLFEWWGRKPQIHRGIAIDSLRRYFDALLERGLIGGQMFVQINRSQNILPFIKYGMEGSSGIRFALPLVPDSELFFRSVETALSGSGFPVRIEEPSSEEPRRFLVVNLGSDTREAIRLVRTTLDFHAPAESSVDVWFKGLRTGPMGPPPKAASGGE